MFNSMKGRLVHGRIFQGKEPPQFIALFQPMIVLKGGFSSGYKSHLEAKGLKDETYAADGVALFRVSGTTSHNNRVIQVDTAIKKLMDGDAISALDPRLEKDSANELEHERILDLALQCLQSTRDSWPSMKSCAEILGSIMEAIYRAIFQISLSEFIKR